MKIVKPILRIVVEINLEALKAYPNPQDVVAAAVRDKVARMAEDKTEALITNNNVDTRFLPLIDVNGKEFGNVLLQVVS